MKIKHQSKSPPKKHQKLTRRSFPFKSNVLSAPRRGNVSNALTLSNNAALGPASCREWLSNALPGSSGFVCRVVTPPCDDDVIIGTGCPVADSGGGVWCWCWWLWLWLWLLDVGGGAALRVRETYGVYVVRTFCVGCLGGGRTGPARAEADCGYVGEVGEVGRLMLDEEGEEAEEEGGERTAGTTSG